jgi:hypothetical protein
MIEIRNSERVLSSGRLRRAALRHPDEGPTFARLSGGIPGTTRSEFGRSQRSQRPGVPRAQHWREQRGPHREPAGRGSRAGLEPPQGAEGDIGGASIPARRPRKGRCGAMWSEGYPQAVSHP